MRTVKLGWLALMLIPLLVAGCATQEIKVACDGKLQSINAPAGAKGAQVARSSGASEAKNEGSQ